MERPGKEEYLMGIAKAASIRSTCPDLQVGCVIATIDGHVLSIGYNGSPKKEKHCKIDTITGKCLENNNLHRVIHAEANAIAFSARKGIALDGSIAYVTEKPCEKCRMLLKQAGIVNIITPEDL